MVAIVVKVVICRCLCCGDSDHSSGYDCVKEMVVVMVVVCRGGGRPSGGCDGDGSDNYGCDCSGCCYGAKFGDGEC